MAFEPVEVAKRVGEEAKNILGAAPGLAAQGAAAYVKEGTPSGLIPNVGVAVARQACRRYADNPGGVPGRVAAGLEAVCRPYLDDIGYGVAPTVSKPFEGGQCPVAYRVTYDVQTRTSNAFTCDPLGPASQDDRIIPSSPAPIGPISNYRQVITNATGFNGQDREVAYRFDAANGSYALSLGGSVTRPFRSTCGVSRQVSNVNFVRVDGQPEQCGPAPIVIAPPVPPVGGPGPRIEPFNPAPGVDIDIDVTIGPTGGITFNIGAGPITIDPFPEGGGGGDPGDGEPGTAPGSGLPPGDIGSPGASEDTGEDGQSSGCAPPNSVLVGLKINILASPSFGSEYDPLVRRGVCYAYMGTIGNLALEPSGVALRDGQMLFAPLDNLTCWEVRANVGYLLRVTPYYRALEIAEV